MGEPERPADEEAGTKEKLTTRQAYNIVSDTVTGPNIRFKDNLFQGCAILVCVAVGATVAALLSEERLFAAFLGGFLGLVGGLLVSGVLLMLYRFVMHVCGRHD